MNLSQFDFDLPSRLIANRPCYPRNESRLLVGQKPIIHDKFNHILNYINNDDLFVVNNSKVIPTYLLASCLSKKIKVTLHKKLNLNEWLAFIKPGKKVNEGDIINFTKDYVAIVVKKNIDGEFQIKFKQDEDTLLSKYGKMPLPPYILKSRESDERDFIDYQTIYANESGSIAAPTAGLHFNNEIYDSLKSNNQVAEVTLHVGAGTFQPIRSTIDEHIMHSEKGFISEEVVEMIKRTKSNNGKIIAVGTTTLRLLESAALKDNILSPYSDETDIFIKPGFKFNVVDILLTNFHLPSSTLMVLVSAFAGVDKIKKLYKEAIKNEYRFFSYGDVSLLYRYD